MCGCSWKHATKTATPSTTCPRETIVLPSLKIEWVPLGDELKMSIDVDDFLAPRHPPPPFPPSSHSRPLRTTFDKAIWFYCINYQWRLFRRFLHRWRRQIDIGQPCIVSIAHSNRTVIAILYTVFMGYWYGLCSTSHSESPKISNLMFQLCSKLYYACEYKLQWLMRVLSLLDSLGLSYIGS